MTIPAAALPVPTSPPKFTTVVDHPLYQLAQSKVDRIGRHLAGLETRLEAVTHEGRPRDLPSIASQAEALAGGVALAPPPVLEDVPHLRRQIAIASQALAKSEAEREALRMQLTLALRQELDDACHEFVRDKIDAMQLLADAEERERAFVHRLERGGACIDVFRSVPALGEFGHFTAKHVERFQEQLALRGFTPDDATRHPQPTDDDGPEEPEEPTDD